MKRNLMLIVAMAFVCLQGLNAQWTVNGSNIYNTNSGNVGIGNNAPSTLLYVGKIMTEPTITVRNLGGAGGATYSMVDDASGAFWKFKATNTGGFKIRDNANALDVFVVEPNSAANVIYINSAGSLGVGTSAPHSSALIDLNSTTMGMLPPRMTLAQLNAIAGPADGLLVYCTDCGPESSGALSMYMGGSWYTMSMNCLIQAPSESTHITSGTQIVWNWNAAAGATGYKWNSANDYATAEDMGANLSKTENGLACNTACTRYVWSYNSCGNSSAVTLTATTAECASTCGSSIEIAHVAGSVAPVTKTVTYGTVDGVPGAPSLCWITSNLGADNQAASVDDGSEASAGWYWQFNHQQGFKHDGSTRTPGTAWVSGYNENTDWQPANDPCALLIGAGWRIPTVSEWNNVINAALWGDWSGPWSSLLKMHAAGYLQDSNGQCVYRGTNGVYWTSSQTGNTLASNLLFYNAACFIGNSNKANGFSIRCLTD